MLTFGVAQSQKLLQLAVICIEYDTRVTTVSSCLVTLNYRSHNVLLESNARSKYCETHSIRPSWCSAQLYCVTLARYRLQLSQKQMYQGRCTIKPKKINFIPIGYTYGRIIELFKLVDQIGSPQF